MDQHQQTSRHPNHHWFPHIGLQATWILCLSSLPPDSRPWFPNEMQNVLSSEKRTLDHWVTVQLFFSIAQVRCFWRCFWYFFLPVNFVFNMLWHSTLWTAPFQWWPSVTYPLCGGRQWSSSGPLPSQQCSPLLCFQRTRETHNLHCMDCHLLNLKCKYFNILRYWILFFHEL